MVELLPIILFSYNFRYKLYFSYLKINYRVIFKIFKPVRRKFILESISKLTRARLHEAHYFVYDVSLSI